MFEYFRKPLCSARTNRQNGPPNDKQQNGPNIAYLSRLQETIHMQESTHTVAGVGQSRKR